MSGRPPPCPRRGVAARKRGVGEASGEGTVRGGGISRDGTGASGGLGTAAGAVVGVRVAAGPEGVGRGVGDEAPGVGTGDEVGVGAGGGTGVGDVGGGVGGGVGDGEDVGGGGHGWPRSTASRAPGCSPVVIVTDRLGHFGRATTSSEDRPSVSRTSMPSPARIPMPGGAGPGPVRSSARAPSGMTNARTAPVTIAHAPNLLCRRFTGISLCGPERRAQGNGGGFPRCGEPRRSTCRKPENVHRVKRPGAPR